MISLCVNQYCPAVLCSGMCMELLIPYLEHTYVYLLRLQGNIQMPVGLL